MATREMQMAQVATGSPIARRTTMIVAVAVALLVGALIGRETATRSQTADTVRPAVPITLTGTDSMDAARRAEVYKAIGAIDEPITFVGMDSQDAARRAEVYKAITALDTRGKVSSSIAPSLTNGERRALINRLVSEFGA